MPEVVEEAADPPKTKSVRSSSRERTLTEKGKELHEQQAKKNENKFNKVYESWKRAAKEIRSKLKTCCSPENLNNAKSAIKSTHSAVSECYEMILRNHTVSPETAKKMDACIALTTNVLDLINKRLENIDITFNDRLEKERVRMVLNKDEYGSIFGRTQTETVISKSRQKLDDELSVTSKSSNKRADAEADLAAKQQQAKTLQELHAQQAKLDKLKSEWKLIETQLLAELKQKAAEVKSKLEEEEIKLQQLQVDNEVKIAEARVKAYNNFDVFERCEEASDFKCLYDSQNTEYKCVLNPQATPFRPSHLSSIPLKTQEEASFAQAIASSLTLSRLPVPEPTIFTGDPLKYTDWKISFTALIGKKPLPTSEKISLGKHAKLSKDSFIVTQRTHIRGPGQYYRTTMEAHLWCKEPSGISLQSGPG